MAKEIVTLSLHGEIHTDMQGFSGTDCVKSAAETTEALAVLGIKTHTKDLAMKDVAMHVSESLRHLLAGEEDER